MQSPYDYKIGFDVADNRWKKKIEDIKAEIEAINPDDYSEYPDHFRKGLEKTLEIIDNHISGKEQQ